MLWLLGFHSGIQNESFLQLAEKSRKSDAMKPRPWFSGIWDRTPGSGHSRWWTWVVSLPQAPDLTRLEYVFHAGSSRFRPHSRIRPDDWPPAPPVETYSGHFVREHWRPEAKRIGAMQPRKEETPASLTRLRVSNTRWRRCHHLRWRRAKCGSSFTLRFWPGSFLCLDQCWRCRGAWEESSSPEAGITAWTCAALNNRVSAVYQRKDEQDNHAVVGRSTLDKGACFMCFRHPVFSGVYFFLDTAAQGATARP